MNTGCVVGYSEVGPKRGSGTWQPISLPPQVDLALGIPRPTE
jgi:hypothetical protein